MNKFFVKDCPEDRTIFSWIDSQINFKEAYHDLQCSVPTDNWISIPHRLNIDRLRQITEDCLDQNGVKGWQTKKGDARAYGGLSLVYNPNLRENTDPNQSTLGTKTNAPAEFYWANTSRFNSIKHTYFDTYGFRHLSPAVTNSSLREFIKGFRLTPTRGRIGVLDADYYDRVGEEFLWHKDEPVYENLRLNIPLVGDETFMFQSEGQTPMTTPVGNIYTTDTHIAHRVYATAKSMKKRIHLVLGFSPWLDYNQEDDSYTVNEFFGKIHPIDLLFKGLAHPEIGGE
jgi:hypothetical protein